MEDNVYDVSLRDDQTEENDQKKKIEVSYYQARFTQKCGAILLDFILFALLALGLFIGTKSIVEATPYYQEINQKYDDARLNSKLYVYNKDTDRVEDIVTYLNRTKSMSTIEKEDYLLDSINGFFLSLPNETSNLQTEFEEYILNHDFLYEGVPYYIKDNNGEIIKNPNLSIPSSAYYDNVLSKYFDEVALAEFTILTPNVLDYQRYQSNMLLFLEIPAGVSLSAIIIWYIIPVCFSRGKRTLGRLAFHTALIGPDNYSLKIGRFTIRFLIFFFAELVLSVFTLCIPLIISLSMSAFSKKKQNFHDYMLNIREIDTYDSKIFKNKFEIIKNKSERKPIDFSMKRDSL